MKKKIIIICLCSVGLYVALSVIGTALAFSQIRNLNNQIKCDQVDNLVASVKLIEWEIFLVRPILNTSDQFTPKLKLLDFASQNPNIIKELMGVENEKTFLLVLQNNAELRPSGGIWGAYGILKIKNCQITSFKTADTYYLDQQNKGKFTPPAGTESIIGDEWRFWNANWSPDFKKSVEQGLYFYRQVDPSVSFDGVIGPNVDYLLSLIKISGPIQLAGHNFTLNSDNFIQKMIYEPATPAITEMAKDQQSVISPTEKNLVIADIGKSIIDQILTNNKIQELVDPTVKALTDKDVILYFSNPASESAVEKFGWAGQLDPKNNFISVVDANFGSKLDFQISKTIRVTKNSATEYRVDLDYSNRVNPNSIDQPFLIYRDLVRVFVPNGSKLIQQQGGQLSAEIKNDPETGLSYMSSMLILKPGERGTISLTYALPANLSDRKIQIIKQAGQHALIINNLHK